MRSPACVVCHVATECFNPGGLHQSLAPPGSTHDVMENENKSQGTAPEHGVPLGACGFHFLADKLILGGCARALCPLGPQGISGYDSRKVIPGGSDRAGSTLGTCGLLSLGQ